MQAQRMEFWEASPRCCHPICLGPILSEPWPDLGITVLPSLGVYLYVELWGSHNGALALVLSFLSPCLADDMDPFHTQQNKPLLSYLALSC